MKHRHKQRQEHAKAVNLAIGVPCIVTPTSMAKLKPGDFVVFMEIEVLTGQVRWDNTLPPVKHVEEAFTGDDGRLKIKIGNAPGLLNDLPRDFQECYESERRGV